MQRFVLFAVLLVCLVCVYQATAQEATQEGTSQTELDNVKKTLQDTVSNIEKKAKEVFENMNMGEALDNVKQFLESTATKLQEEASKMMNKK